MPYITIKQPPKYYQMTFEDIMAGIDDLSKYVIHDDSIALSSQGWRFFDECFSCQKILPNLDNVEVNKQRTV